MIQYTFNNRIITLALSLLLLPVFGEFASAQVNERKALRDASGTYKGSAAEAKGLAPFGTGKGKGKFKETGKASTIKAIEDGNSITGKIRAKSKKTKVSRGGKRIVVKTKKSKATEKDGGAVTGVFTGFGNGFTNKKGNRFVGETKTKAATAPANALTRGFYKGKN